MIGLPTMRHAGLKSILIASFIIAGVLASIFVPKRETEDRSSNDRPASEILSNQQSGQHSESATALPRVEANTLTAQLPLSFEPNRGQTDRHVKYLSRGRGYSLFLTATEAVFSLRHSERKERNRERPGTGSATAQDSSSALRLTLKNANRKAQLQGGDQLAGVQNYLIGNDSRRWQVNVPSYRRVTYEEIYPGIKLTYYGNQQQLEYDFEVAAGADASVIRLACDGTDEIAVDNNGDLFLRFKGGEIRQH